MTPPALIMVAPNGARRSRGDHPALPLTIAEIAETARTCQAAGAGAIHLHVRDADGRHVLDAGLYREAAAAVREATRGRMLVQITSEAVGLYSPQEQIAAVEAAGPEAVSVALREMVPTRAEERAAAAFYWRCREAGIGVQHILYSPEELDLLSGLIARRVIPPELLSVILVLGRYSEGQESDPRNLTAWLARLAASGLDGRAEWMLCAFGRGETASLAAALAFGGHARVGFENSLWEPDGSVAPDNAARVARIRRIADGLTRPTDDSVSSRRALGLPTGV
jgi:3-keto-5-aminohexanoate cleavage enzyme